MVAFESLAVTTVMPTVSDALDGASLYAFAFAGPLATGVVGMVLAGPWSDRSGPRTPLLVAVGLFTAGILVAGAAPSMEVLVAGRLLQGFGGGAMTVALYVVVARLYPAMLHPRVFAWFAAAWIIPSLVGPAGAGAVAQHAGWRWVFLGVALLVIPTTLMLVPALRRIGPPETPGEAAPRGRLAWAALAAAAVLGLNLAAQVPLPWSVVVAVGTGRGRPRRAARRGPRRHHACGARPAERHRDPRPGLGGVPGRRGVPAVPAHRAVRVLADDRGDRPDVRRCRLGRDVVAAGAPRGPAAPPRRRSSSARRWSSSRSPGCWSPPPPTSRPAVAIASWTLAGAGMGLVYSRLTVLVLAYSAPGTQGVEQLGPVDRGLDRRSPRPGAHGPRVRRGRPQPGRAVHRRPGGRRRLRGRRRTRRTPGGRGTPSGRRAPPTTPRRARCAAERASVPRSRDGPRHRGRPARGPSA